jgi:hypothetical protein
MGKVRDIPQAQQRQERAMLHLLSRAIRALDHDPAITAITAEMMAQKAFDLADPEGSSPPLARDAAMVYLQELATRVICGGGGGSKCLGPGRG